MRRVGNIVGIFLLENAWWHFHFFYIPVNTFIVCMFVCLYICLFMSCSVMVLYFGLSTE